MKKHEPVYNVYTYFEAGELRALGTKQYYRQGSDAKKLAFLQARATLDFRNVGEHDHGLTQTFTDFTRVNHAADGLAYSRPSAAGRRFPLFAKMYPPSRHQRTSQALMVVVCCSRDQSTTGKIRRNRPARRCQVLESNPKI
jgi:hypothetical protein